MKSSSHLSLSLHEVSKDSNPAYAVPVLPSVRGQGHTENSTFTDESLDPHSSTTSADSLSDEWEGQLIMNIYKSMRILH